MVFFNPARTATGTEATINEAGILEQVPTLLSCSALRTLGMANNIKVSLCVGSK